MKKDLTKDYEKRIEKIEELRQMLGDLPLADGDDVNLLDEVKIELKKVLQLAQEFGCPEDRDPWEFIREELWILRDLRS